ncbi:MAG: glutathione S-transferase family protein [Pseudomonadota bacterium]
MGLIQNGRWVDQWYDTASSDGAFQRKASSFRNWVTADGAAGPSGQGGYRAEQNRYHLYVSYACPWAHRTLIFRALKDLQDYVDVTVVEPTMLEHGWEMQDTLTGLDYLYQLYLKADASYEGRVTVPVLWDKHTQTIVSNESAEIIRMFNSAFNHLTGNEADFYPTPLRAEIDALNERIYNNINNGVYRAGFATSQSAYAEAFTALFGALDWVEDRLSKQRYLLGDTLTEADWRLFTTLVRFDAVYVGHFKCNLRQLAEYPSLSGYLRDLYQVPGVAETVHMDHIKTHYYVSHRTINPTGVVPLGPQLDFLQPHNRAELSAHILHG